MASEGEEDVIKRGASQANVVDRDRRLIKIANDLNEVLCTTSCRYRESARVLVYGAVPATVPREHLDRTGDVGSIVHDNLNSLPADLRLQLVGGAACDDTA